MTSTDRSTSAALPQYPRPPADQIAALLEAGFKLARANGGSRRNAYLFPEGKSEADKKRQTTALLGAKVAKGWQQSASLTVGQALDWLDAGGWLAIIPGTGGLLAMDQDAGPDESVQAWLGEPLGSQQTLSGGFHWLYGVDPARPIKQGKWIIGWKSGDPLPEAITHGDSRYTDGYVILYNAAAFLEARARVEAGAETLTQAQTDSIHAAIEAKGEYNKALKKAKRPPAKERSTKKTTKNNEYEGAIGSRPKDLEMGHDYATLGGLSEGRFDAFTAALNYYRGTVIAEDWPRVRARLKELLDQSGGGHKDFDRWADDTEETIPPYSKPLAAPVARQRRAEAKEQARTLADDAALSDAALAQYLIKNTPLKRTVRCLDSGTVYAFSKKDRLWTPQLNSKPFGIIGRFIDRYLPDYVQRHFAAAMAAANKLQGEEGTIARRELEAARTAQQRLLGQHARRMAIAAEVYQRPDLDADADALTGKNHLVPVPGGRVWDLKLFSPTAPRSDYERERLPEDNFTWEMACTPSKGDYSTFTATVGATLGDDNFEALLDCLGYLIQGNREAERAFIFRGEGRQGKSMIATKLFSKSILGGGAMECARDYFFGRKDRHDQHLQSHLGKRLVTVTDPSGPLRETEFLSYTGGGGTIKAERKGGEIVDFEPTACLLINGQDARVRIDGNDLAVRDRLWTIHFPPIPPDQRDRDLINKIRPEAQAIAWEAICRAAYYLKEGCLASEHRMIESTGALAHEHNAIAQFAEEALVMDEEGCEITAVIFRAWQAWCDENNVADGRKPTNWFTANLRKHLPRVTTDTRRIHGKKHRVLWGVTLDEEFTSAAPRSPE